MRPMKPPAAVTTGLAMCVVLAFASLMACGSVSRQGGASAAKDSLTSTAATPEDCPDLMREIPEELSSDEPFGTVGPNCTVVPNTGPGWSESVSCDDVWQVGARLPKGYLGCAAPPGVVPLARTHDCEDPRLSGAWVYGNLAAREGEVIRRVPFEASPSGTVDC
jgi:hypothetical protein